MAKVDVERITLLITCPMHAPDIDCGLCGSESHEFVQPCPMNRAHGCARCGWSEETHPEASRV